MKITLSHPTGNRNVRAVLDGLDKSGVLESFHTAIALSPNSIFIKLLPSSIKAELLRRTFPLSSKKVHTHPIREVSRLVFLKAGLYKIVKRESSWASVDGVYNTIDRMTAKSLSKNNKATAVYAYEDGALATFIRAKQLGMKCIYDLPIAYWETARKLMFEEAERLPNWADTLGGGIHDSTIKLDRKTKELEMADIVVCPGRFVSESLPEWAIGKRKIISPFGSPVCSNILSEKSDKVKSLNRKLRVLFAGSLGQRKGLGDLFAAVKLLQTEQIELVAMGSLLSPLAFYKTELNSFVYEPGRPHDKVLALMRTCDVFCLPSIVEGRALVMQEAMSQGLPLIITDNTGGADLIIEGATGFLVPIRSPEEIAKKLAWFLENREKIPEMGKLAQEHAATYTWQKYQQHIIERLKAFLN